jgi:hypothetical protein
MNRWQALALCFWAISFWTTLQEQPSLKPLSAILLIVGCLVLVVATR